MSNTIKKPSGGGGYGLLNHTAIPKKSKFFRPIIASSLVAMLGVSIVNASVTCDTASTGSAPSLCFRGADTKLTTLDFTISGNAFAPTHNNTPIENLLFKFYGLSTSSTPAGAWTVDTKTYTITSPRDSGGDKFTLSGNGKGMVMGANGTGTLSVDFAPTGWDNRRTFELKLEHVNANTLAFKGNIDIYAGKGDGKLDETKNAKFDARFSGKGVEGNIRILHPSGGGDGNTKGHKSNFTFTNGANLNGNVFAETGINTFTFENGNLIGNVGYIGPHWHDGGKNTIIFKANGNKLIGNIKATMANTVRGTNEILFEQGGSVQGSIYSGDGLNTIESKVNTLTITANTIEAVYGFNNITATDLKLNTNLIKANGKATKVGITKNTITATGTATIKADKIHTISSINAISITGKDSSLTASLESTGGLNVIELKDGARFFAGSMKVKGAPNIANVNNGNNIIDIAGNSQVNVGTLSAKDGNANKNGANVFAFRQNGEVTIRDGYSATSDGKNIIASVVAGTPATSGGAGAIPTEGLALSLEDKQIASPALSTPISLLGTHASGVKKSHNALLKVEVKRNGNAGSSTHSFTLTGLASGTISKINSPLSNTATITLANNSAFAGTIDLGGKEKIIMEKSSKLLIESMSQTLSHVVLNKASFDKTQLSFATLHQTNTIIDLASMARSSETSFRLLTIGEKTDTTNTKGFQGSNALFKIHIDTSKDANVANTNTLGGQDANSDSGQYGHAYSDRILIESGKAGTHHAQILYDGAKTDISKISYKQGTGTEEAGNIAIATIKTSTNITLASGTQLLGYDVVGTQLDKTDTDENGRTKDTSGGDISTKSYTTYFIKSMDNQGASKANQLSAITALSNNYMLYLANLNSLNKRMGELRENTASQGAWLRIFNGMQSTSFKEMLDSRAIYTTIQAGYDYTFGFKGASNYLGVALSYANALGSSLSYRDINGIDKGLKNMNSNAFELAIYNAYVQDGASKATGFKNGLYSDSIAKFSYILGSYNFLDQSNKTYDTSNFAFTLSQELGYRFLLGNDREFYIDPQAEFAFGFFSNSNLAQSMGNNFFLKAMQDSILTLRSRVGSSFGYKFDKFTQNKGFSSSLYLGTYFVSDVILGGEVSINTNANKPLEIKPLTSDMRFVLNLGTNFKIKDNTRIYFDFERSFGGRITTDYQLNLGVRYSFGTSKYTPYTETTQEAPKESNTLKEVEPTKGYYIEVLEKEANKLTAKEKKVLEKLKDNLKVQSKTQGNKTMKVYLVGAFKDEAKAKEGKVKLDGVLKELKSKGNIIEVE